MLDTKRIGCQSQCSSPQSSRASSSTMHRQANRHARFARCVVDFLVNGADAMPAMTADCAKAAELSMHANASTLIMSELLSRFPVCTVGARLFETSPKCVAHKHPCCSQVVARAPWVSSRGNCREELE